VELARYADPSLIIDGEVQAGVAVNAKKLEAAFPFSSLKGGANVLIFPDLQSCNIACKLLGPLGGAETLGPILAGMAKPVHLLQRGAEVEEIVNITTIAVVDAQDSSTSAGARVAAAVASVG
jgi:malate dehydrogenase (oxaloacetate-decarboxylating)(NADP+)